MSLWFRIFNERGGRIKPLVSATLTRCSMRATVAADERPRKGGRPPIQRTRPGEKDEADELL